MTAESLQPPLTHFAFINYGDKTTTVSLNLKEDVGLNEIVPDGDVEGGALLSARDASGNCTLSLKPQVVAGFTARTAVTFKLISPRIDVVSWAGKDPPTPPPPVLPRYEDTGDFVEQFEALLGVADADDQGKGDRVVPARKSG